MLLLAWMAGSTWWHVCKIKLLCGDTPSPTVSTPVLSEPAPALVVADGENFRFDAPGNFSFAKSGDVANRQGTGALLDSLSSYLKANPGKAVTINGYYAPGEQNLTAFTTLGLARANDIKQVLVQQGVPATLLTTQGIETNDLVFSAKGDSIYGGLAFTFGSPVTPPADTTTMATPPVTTTVVTLTEPVTEEALARKEKFTSVFEPIDLYFPLNRADYIKTEETAKFFDEAVAYLAKNKDKKLVLTGHTDNSGSDAVNLELSRDRANSVKVKLRKSGITSNQVQVQARGETQPKADNGTLSGRKANRRVTVVVQ